ncbi:MULTISPECIES: DUF2520 domain-containing protein [Microbacterium]|uniref:DUF2520 domain-containing protein n=1 Tax=Microbacterium TaxID=33882 RepID=UPI0027809201|nr:MULTISPECIES: DUF2520 domain-containing protein [Microbacterium]MDQ1082843.1 putative short-subunit dehydrogenase-like oxidoreductase (DUF2520 family) [Microbacterium sp. SORGH_AS_0344]MDQ1168388.1 putative short-subunit dehydrogenase-like oxidoreductase (DUF2520 family) [Microbacterium proteolyticum]
MTTSPSLATLRHFGPVLIVGDGRMGRALAGALDAARVPLLGPAGRGETGADAGIVLLAVPDAAIADAARAIAPGRFVGHLSGASDLSPLRGHEAFSIHPLMTVTDAGASFAGVTAALSGSTSRALTIAEALTEVLGMTGVTVRDEDRAAYHAAASIAANFLVTLEGMAEDLAATADVERDALVPLVRAAVANWAEHGAAAALTGPVSRGDDATIARQRQALVERLPERVALFDALVDATRDLAAARSPKEATT